MRQVEQIQEILREWLVIFIFDIGDYQCNFNNIFFWKKVIKYSVWAILISILANLIYCIHLYGMGVFLQYLPQVALSTDFPFWFCII